MNYSMTTPCAECPFLNIPRMKRAFTITRLREFAQGEFPCHKTAEINEDDEEGGSRYLAKSTSAHCAGALIFNEKRGQPNQMMRISGRLGLYDYRKLDMKAGVR